MRAQFDHEKLEVYQLELAFTAWVTPLMAKVKQSGATVRTAEVVNQLDRASLSALLNTAEGNGRRQAQTRARFFDDARGSAAECAACLDALVAKTLCSVEEVHEGKEMLPRIVSMLTKLVACFDQSSSIIREEADEKEIHDEEEDENE
ncbi:MAG: four helix bundle protein [Chthoniobacterales bacterium]